MKKAKSIPNFIKAELKMHGWMEIGKGMMQGFIYVKDGVELVIVPSTMGRMYHLTRTKMSETTTTFIHEPELLRVIETEGD
jgi:hypothetical protein